jgi:phosphoglycolate phosphatase-like HAD superfamily hydrolase
MHICFDWDGTLAKIDVAHEAAIRRSKTLGEQFDPTWLSEAMKTDSHYKVNKELIAKYTGVKEDRLLTQIMTDLFRYHYLGVANELKEQTLFEGIKELLLFLKSKKVKLSIATTLRKDIVCEVLKNLEIYDLFDYVAGNNPELDYDKKMLMLDCEKNVSKIYFMVGDKSDDVDAAHKLNTKGILVYWGSHKEYDKADLVVNTVSELIEFFSKAL